MLKHIRFQSTKEYNMAIMHPTYHQEDINRITNYLQWVEPDALRYERTALTTFLNTAGIAGPNEEVSVEFFPEHFVGFLATDDARKYRSFLHNLGLLGRVTGVCDGAIYGSRPDPGQPMTFKLCLALDVDNLRNEDPSDWERSIYP